MQQSNVSKTPSSGMSNVPTIVPYPKIAHIEEVPEIKERLVYIIEGYKLDGISILLFFQDGGLGMRVGDWDGNLFDEKKTKEIGVNYTEILCALMVKARIKQAQFYFSGDQLVDIRTHLNKMVGPGMLKDLCGKVVPTQNVIDIQPLSEDVLAGIDRYVILKHSSFKVIVRGDEMIPMYAIAGADNGKEADVSAKTVA